MGVIDCVASSANPADTTKLWYDISSASKTAPGILKAYSGSDWDAATPAVIANHIISKSSLSNLTLPLGESDGGTGQTTFAAAVNAFNSVLQSTTAAFTTALEAKLNGLDAAIVLKGEWDASSGSFPASTEAGWSYIVSTGGTVDGVEFSADDRLISLLDSASTSTYAANWHKADYSDLVTSVAGLTGAVGSAALLTALSLDDVLKADQSDRIEANIGFDIKDSAIASGVLAIDFSDSNNRSIMLDEDVTSITFTGAEEGDDLKLYFTQDATGGRTVAGWPSSVKWFGAVGAPTITAAANSKDVVYLEYDGTDYLASYKQNATP